MGNEARQFRRGQIVIAKEPMVGFTIGREYVIIKTFTVAGWWTVKTVDDRDRVRTVLQTVFRRR